MVYRRIGCGKPNMSLMRYDLNQEDRFNLSHLAMKQAIVGREAVVNLSEVPTMCVRVFLFENWLEEVFG